MKVSVYANNNAYITGNEFVTFAFLKYLHDRGHEVNVQFSKPTLIRVKNSFGIDVQYTELSSLPESDVFVNITNNYIRPFVGKKNFALIPNPAKLKKLLGFDRAIVTSKFAKSLLRQYTKLPIDVISPPIDIDKFVIRRKKNQIITVGSFYEYDHANNKNHMLMVDAFKELYKKDSSWNMVIIGSVNNKKLYDNIRDMCKGLPISFYSKLPFESLRELYGESRVYWHAAGFYGTVPENFEMFPISVVEAMASGAVPVVYNAGGTADINGPLHFDSIDSLVEQTLTVKDDSLVSKMVECAKEYDIEVVYEKYDKIIGS